MGSPCGSQGPALGLSFPCRLIREQLLKGDFTVNMRLLQVMVGGARAVSDTGRLGPEQGARSVHSFRVQAPKAQPAWT